MSVNMQLVHVFIILASCKVCGAEALVGGSETADVGDPKVIRSASFATFEIQRISGYYVSLSSVNDAEIQIVSGRLYDLQITVTVLKDGKNHDEMCAVYVLEQVWLRPYNTLSYYNCDGILGKYSRH